jgi:long-chain acyl-CoA synthetase
MIENFWKDKYPEGIPSEVDVEKYNSVVEVMEESFTKFANKPAFTHMGRTMTYGELETLSAQFASYLQNHTTLEKGDRIAVQLPNIVQYPVVVFGAMRAGIIVVNTNPLYTEREMEHQFNDSGAKALVCYAGMASLAQNVVPRTGVKHVIVTEIADLHPFPKKQIINTVVKRVKKMVPAYDNLEHITLNKALKLGSSGRFDRVVANRDDIAVLQYTGGTTGVAKGAMLTHGNLISNMCQAHVFFEAVLNEGQETVIAPLPLYHIYSFTVNCMIMMYTGNHSVLIPNPRDIPGFIKELGNWDFSGMLGINTLFVALCNNEDFRKLDFSSLKLTISGGMALTKDAADQWEQVTGCIVSEGYGMTETSPIVSFNPPGYGQIGTIGIPAPNTICKTIDDDGNDLPLGEPGELCVKGPQVMKGYWQRPDETAKTITEDGWLKTGDVAVIKDDGYMKIVDRKKDMIIVSGFNVYPNELEDFIVSHPDIVECAAVGVPDDKSGEAVKVFAVTTNKNLTDKELRDFCRDGLTAYKVPKFIEFRDELPKTNVGKILRRELRDEEMKKIGAA